MIDKFGKSLRQLREALGLSQVDLAGDLGSTQRHISFLETGRTRPTRDMLGRIVTALNLTQSQRSSLFAASGFHNPYGKFDWNSAEVQSVLNMVDTNILANWPFPAFALDHAWNVLRANEPALAMLGPFMPDDEVANLLSIFISSAFSGLITNWEEVSTCFYFRAVSAAEHSPQLAKALKAARSAGTFDHIPHYLTEADKVRLFAPARLAMPDGSQLTLSSLVGALPASQDATISQIEIEMMFPLDPDSADAMRAPY